MKFKASIFLLFICLALHSQTILNIHVTDLQKRPISFAVLKYNSFVFTCNDSGFVSINNYTPGSKISVYKFGFADTCVVIARTSTPEASLNLVIALKLKPMILPEVSVSSSLLEEINPAKAHFILGYELKGNYLVELLSNGIIIVTDAENKIKFRSRSIQNANDVVKDPYGHLHILADKSAFKISADSVFIKFDTMRVSLEKLVWNLKYCDEVLDTSYFIRRYKDNNQTMAFFAVSSIHSKHVRQLKEISDVERKKAVAAFANETNSFNQYVASLGLSRMTASTPAEIDLVEDAQRMSDQLEINYTQPSYSILKLVNDSLCLFAHDVDSMFVYDKNWNLVKSKRIDYHHLKTWGKELIVDEEKRRVYAKFIEKSKPMIAEIDLQTGELKPGFTTLQAKFPTKIKIRDNVVYFMARQKDGTGYTVYSQNLKTSK